MEITRIESAFKPNRAYRRTMAGARCNLCGLGIIANDLALVSLEYDGVRKATEPIHQQCTSLLWDLADAINQEDTDNSQENS